MSESMGGDGGIPCCGVRYVAWSVSVRNEFLGASCPNVRQSQCPVTSDELED